ncbi:MAG: NfeD family protein [Cyanobacteriota bacterium]|nr:NfeD family protein [Cyanobacteriota bacterium]
MFWKKSKPQTKPFFEFTKQAIVDEDIIGNRTGRVRYAGTYWNAISLDKVSIKEGEIVYVIGRENITLLVVREPAN